MPGMGESGWGERANLSSEATSMMSGMSREKPALDRARYIE
jgi:hypothetical protein